LNEGEIAMKKLIAALALTAAAATAPAFAGNVGISISVGEPGFYGQLDIGGYGRPGLIYSQPVILAPRYRGYAPVYVRAPRDHYRNWGRYCGRYQACARPFISCATSGTAMCTCRVTATTTVVATGAMIAVIGMTTAATGVTTVATGVTTAATGAMIATRIAGTVGMAVEATRTGTTITDAAGGGFMPR
jgi:X-X-X-Leu-X-X-Gly heptad repeat protein